MKIIKGKDLLWLGVTNTPDIKKQTFIEKGLIPKLMTFGKAVFKPGQQASNHKHPTMYEVFYILSGKALFVINEKENIIKKDECIIIEPGELHAQSNPFKEDVEWIYFGIATD